MPCHFQYGFSFLSSPFTSCAGEFLTLLEGTARYVGLLLAPVEGFGQGFLALRAKKKAFYAVLAY